MKTYSQVGERNKLTDILKLFSYLKNDRQKLIMLITYHNTPLILMYSVPVFFLCSFILATNYSALYAFVYDSAILRLCLAITISSFFAFVLTSLRPFLWLGQAERYFEYSLPFIALLTVFCFLKLQLDYGQIVFSLFIGHLIIIIATYLFLNHKPLKENLVFSKDRNFPELLNLLASLKDAKILTLPPKLSFKISALSENENIRYYYRFINQPKRGFKYLEEDYLEFEVVRPDLSYMISKYDLNTIIVDHEFLNWVQKRDIAYDFEQYELVFNNKNYSVYIVN